VGGQRRAEHVVRCFRRDSWKVNLFNSSTVFHYGLGELRCDDLLKRLGQRFFEVAIFVEEIVHVGDGL